MSEIKKCLTRAEIRRRADLTQVRLGRLTGINPTQICLWERGDLQLLDSDVRKIAEVISAELNRIPRFSPAQLIAIFQFGAFAVEREVERK